MVIVETFSVKEEDDSPIFVRFYFHSEADNLNARQ